MFVNVLNKPGYKRNNCYIPIPFEKSLTKSFTHFKKLTFFMNSGNKALMASCFHKRKMALVCCVRFAVMNLDSQMALVIMEDANS